MMLGKGHNVAPMLKLPCFKNSHNDGTKNKHST